MFDFDLHVAPATQDGCIAHEAGTSGPFINYTVFPTVTLFIFFDLLCDMYGHITARQLRCSLAANP